mgnify:FL=1
MEKITMDEVQIKLEQIEASLQLTLEGMCGDFTAVGNSTGENEKLLSLSACRRTNTIYAPALDLICDALAALSDRVGSAVR